MSGSHSLERWLVSREAELASAGVTATAGRGPMMAGRPSSTWISFETARSAGRLVLWSTGRCQLDASSYDGTKLCATEREVATAGELEDALLQVTGCLSDPSRR